MELSILVAQVAAIVYVSAGINALIHKKSFTKIVEDFEKSPGLTFITGFMTLLLGMLLIKYHNIWVKDWTVLVTIIGWLSLAKGVMLIVFPQSIPYFKNMYKNSQPIGTIMLILGLVFAYFGFIA